MSDRIYPDEHLPVMASSNNPPAGTPDVAFYSGTWAVNLTIRDGETVQDAISREAKDLERRLAEAIYGKPVTRPADPLVFPEHVPTPNAVEEARKGLIASLYSLAADENAAIDRLIAAAQTEERKKCAAEYLQRMSEDPESAVAAQMARTQAFADVRRVVEEVAVCNGGFQRNPSAVKDDLLAALDALERGP